MDKYERLEQIVETNFQLNAMQTRELGVEVRKRFDSHMEFFNSQIEGVVRALDATREVLVTGLKETGVLFETRMNEQADRMDLAVEAIRTLGDGNVDIRKEINDLKRRVKELEDRAS